MKHSDQQKVQIDTTTGEVYTCYPITAKKGMGLMRRLVHWCSQKIDNHYDRLIELRVYDDKRYDYRIKE